MVAQPILLQWDEDFTDDANDEEVNFQESNQTVLETYENYLDRNEDMKEAEQFCKEYWRAL